MDNTINTQDTPIGTLADASNPFAGYSRNNHVWSVQRYKKRKNHKGYANSSSLYNQPAISDVLIKVAGVEIFGHKSHLASGSGYFFKAFLGPYLVRVGNVI